MTDSEEYAFDEFTLDVPGRRLSRGRDQIALAPKAFDLLVALIRNAQRLLTKDELLSLVWPRVAVEEGILTVHVSALRRALGDMSRRPAFIQTVSRSGYRFIAPVEKTARRQSAARESASIAVLPFVDSGADNGVYFGDGLAEEIINTLARFRNLKVTARTSAFAFRGKEQDLRQIGRALNVRMVLEGSVRRIGSRVRVTTQLINAEDGFQLWSQRYDRELTDIFAVQDDIATSIARALQLTVPSTESEFRRETPRLPAYEAYLKGLHELRLTTAESLEHARAHFEHAIALAPDYAAAHVGLAMCCVSFATESLRPARDVMPTARTEAARALVLNPENRDALAILGTVALTYDYDAAEADRIWQALGRHPDSFDAVYFEMGYLCVREGLAAAIELLEAALESDPLNKLFRAILANTWMWAGQHDRAFAEAAKLLELETPFYGAYGVMTQSYLALGKIAEAVDAAERMYKDAPWHPRAVGMFAAALARSGDSARAQALLREMRRAENPLGVPMGMVAYHLLAGDVQDALGWYEKAVAEREPLAVVYTQDPQTRPLLADPRWTALLKQMSLSR